MSTLRAAAPPPRSWRGGALLSAIGLFFILTRTAVASPPQPVIHMLSNAGMAPFAVHVHALDSNLGAGSSLTARYQWDFGDPQGAYNTLEGFNAAHLYDAPGTYTVTLTVTNEEGFSAQAAASVTVSSDTRVRIHVAANGSDSNDGHSSTNPIRTFAHAMELVDDDTAVLFRRGDVFDVSATQNLQNENWMLGAYGGAGPLPEIRWTGGLGLNVLISMQPASIRDVVIQDLKFDSSYAGSTERNIVDVIMAAGENVTVRGCTFGHITQAVNSERGPVGVLVLENQVPVADSVRAYLCWVQGTDHTILGNVVNGSRFEHNVRLGGANRVLIAHNDLTNSPKTTIWAMEGENVYVRGNQLTSGQLALGPNHSDGSPDVRLQWAVAEGNTIDNALHAEDAALRIKAGTEHVMLRNNILLAPSQSAIQIAGYDPVMDRTNIDIRIYNNTAINGSLDGQFLNVGSGTEQLRVINNLYAAPNLISGVNHTSNVYVEDSGLSGFTEIASNLWSIPAAFAWVPEGYHYVWPYWSDPSGYRSPEEWDGFFQVHDEQYARICVDGTYAPSSESLNGGQAMPVAGVFTDFYGEPRSPGSWTVGAVEGGSEELQCPEPFGGGPFVDDFETDRGWVVENVDAINGIWQRDTPIGGESSGGPAADADGSGQCYLTGNQTGDSDVDGGATLLVSPLLDATWGPEATITFSLWCAGSPGGGSALPPPAPAPGGGGGPGTGDHGSEEEFTGYEPGDDEEGLAISLTSNAGAFWVEVEHLTQSTVGWETRTIRIADYVLPTDTVRVAFIATDLPPDGQLEVAIDDFRLSFAGAIGDVNADGVVTIDDLLIMIQSWGPCPGQGAACPADLNGDGVVGVSDLVLVMMNWQ